MDTLQEAEKFYKERILGWMIADLEKSIVAETNFLTALGCLIYTEIIGAFLPSLSDKKETGSMKEKRFYRCLFRLNSNQYLKTLDRFLRKETNGKGIYSHLRHNMSHKYYPIISKRQNNIVLFIPSVVARDGMSINKTTGITEKSPPIFLSDKGEIVIANKNYINELKESVNKFIQYSFIDKIKEYQEAAIKGIEVVLKGME
jgi:hypothetical protein